MILLIITTRQSFHYFYMQSTATVYERRGVELHRLTSPVTTVIICKFDTDGWNGCQNKSNATERKCARTLVSELISFKFVLRASPFCFPFLRRCAKRFHHKLLIPHCKFTRDFFALLSDSDFFNPLPSPPLPHALQD